MDLIKIRFKSLIAIAALIAAFLCALLSPRAQAEQPKPKSQTQAPAVARDTPVGAPDAQTTRTLRAAPKPVSPRPALTEKEKIEYLLKEVRDSGLIFTRNGTEYPSAKAAEHLRQKWDYAGKRIKTARQFIDYLATKSSVSGKPYMIRLKDGKEVKSHDWLMQALEDLEKGQGNGQGNGRQSVGAKDKKA